MRGYHAGQRAVQRRAGDTTVAERLEHGIRPALPDAAQEFLEGLPLLFVASADSGRARLGVGAERSARLRRHVRRPHARRGGASAGRQPLAQALAAGPAPVGLLGIEPETRRRMRVNGTSTLDADGLHVRTQQVYSNCPKYIQRRHVTAAAATRPRAVERERMTRADRRFVAAADTFVIATAGPNGARRLAPRWHARVSSPCTTTRICASPTTPATRCT